MTFGTPYESLQTLFEGLKRSAAHPSSNGVKGRIGEGATDDAPMAVLQRRLDMTRRFASFVVITVAVLALGRMAYADETFSVQVPFPFVAGGQLHEAGRYSIRVFDNHFNLILAPDNGPTNTLAAYARVEPDPLVRDDVPRLVFDKVGDRYYLVEAWSDGYDGMLLQPAIHGTGSRTVIPTQRAAVTK
jgi:hypothetical protein